MNLEELIVRERASVWHPSVEIQIVLDHLSPVPRIFKTLIPWHQRPNLLPLNNTHVQPPHIKPHPPPITFQDHSRAPQPRLWPPLSATQQPQHERQRRCRLPRTPLCLPPPIQLPPAPPIPTPRRETRHPYPARPIQQLEGPPLHAQSVGARRRRVLRVHVQTHRETEFHEGLDACIALPTRNTPTISSGFLLDLFGDSMANMEEQHRQDMVSLLGQALAKSSSKDESKRLRALIGRWAHAAPPLVNPLRCPAARARMTSSRPAPQNFSLSPTVDPNSSRATNPDTPAGGQTSLPSKVTPNQGIDPGIVLPIPVTPTISIGFLLDLLGESMTNTEAACADCKVCTSSPGTEIWDAGVAGRLPPWGYQKVAYRKKND
ncbi:hypothetical protein BDK51DRAFT_49489 [Blyttiomyces helicus]|uniref:Uncharacterized protein n=1 Tax=Blyttiomyces helicus TaxID=388810 RepID=A0A4P9W0E4_9FUNG|nr:hypothetical protein BDK51DRAFT_49489 [Blyttiomyces helicus]|eukprot:RKO84020.1 hypothetical protein BDK51DRAFT_49489 [Blyttiomyces helicus]